MRQHGLGVGVLRAAIFREAFVAPLLYQRVELRSSLLLV
jgi:hypothetical protein